jgi:hypothetical protein
MIYYSFHKLQEELKKRKLPSGRPYITTLEQLEKIIKPMNVLSFHKKDIEGKISSKLMRLYSLDEIDLICKQIEKIRKK